MGLNEKMGEKENGSGTNFIVCQIFFIINTH